MKRLFLFLFLVAAVMSVPARARAAEEDHWPTPAELAAPSPASALADSTTIVYAQSVIKANLVGMTLTNYGFIGTNFTSRAPSFEFPLGSGYQHLIRGGLWIGGLTYDDNGTFTGVSTAAMDGSAGQSPYLGCEYTPNAGVAGAINRRSKKPNDMFASPGAVSDADYISRFSDMPSNAKTGNVEGHRSLHMTVTQYNYAWSDEENQNILFFHYVIRNDGNPLNDAWIGLYAELASGDMKGQTGSTLYANWFYKKEIGWESAPRLFTERFCLSRGATSAHVLPIDCHYDLVPEVVGIKLLGAGLSHVLRDSMGRDTAHVFVDDMANKQVTLSTWSYNKGSTARDEDVERYALMSAGTESHLPPAYPLPTIFPVADSLNVTTGDPVEVLAVGPFPAIAPGDSVSVDFAFIGATDPLRSADPYLVYELMDSYATTAQKDYDLHYILPVPPPSPRLVVVPSDHAVDFYFDASPQDFLDPTATPPKDFEGYRIYVGENQNDLRMVAQFDLPADSIGFDTGLDSLLLRRPYMVPGDTTVYRYSYHVDHLRDGFKYFGAVTSYDKGLGDHSRESGKIDNEKMFVPGPSPAQAAGSNVTVFPNPYRVETGWDQGKAVTARYHYLWFANLPTQATLKIYTLSGALIYQTDFNGSNYDGRNAVGIYSPISGDLRPNLTGSMFGWDLITRQGQACATGLYLWAVEDKQSGKRQTGKFLVVKSDRENF